jgi:hypothetical protein
VAEVRIEHIWNDRAVHDLLNARNGGLARDMTRRGYQVQRASQQVLRREGRVDHGRLLGSIFVEPFKPPTGGVGVAVGSGLKYASFVEEGTGLYGPLHHRIFPRHGKFLVFTPRKRSASGSYIKAKNRTTVFARSVRGSRGVHFLRLGLRAARRG